MNRTVRVIVLAFVLLMAFSLPASAHVLVVTNPQTGEAVSTHQGKPWQEFKEEVGVDVGWVGGMQSFSAHGGGLIDACEATASNGTVFIGAPWNELNQCKHFGH